LASGPLSILPRQNLTYGQWNGCWRQDICAGDQIQTRKGLVAKMGEGINVAEADFETRWGVMEFLNVQVDLGVENGERIVRA
jgi:hypothetical protein